MHLRFFLSLLFCLGAAVCPGAVNLGESFFTGSGAQGNSELVEPPSKDRVIVVANNNDPQSVSLARYYCQKREIPLENIISLPLSTQETISREEFTSTLYNPLLAELVARGWISGTLSQERDPQGRQSSKLSSHKIDFLVLMRGVPLRISRDEYLLKIDQNKPKKTLFHVNEASVDSELSCMMLGSYPLTAIVPNPLFNKKKVDHTLLQKVIRVSRLDGERSDHVIAMIDSALEGERKGLRGRAYFDVGGPHEKGNTWISQVAQQMQKQGFDITLDRRKTLLDASQRWDAPVIYLGWYSQNPAGAITLRGYRFAPGAIAWHIHSFSAETVRSSRKGWIGIFAQKGAAAALGNVYEPYLELSHLPTIYFSSLMNGMTHGEAAYASSPALSWMTVAIGDPLYRPFATPLSKQLEQVRSWAGRSAYGQYAVIRVMNLLEQRGKNEEALLLGEQCFRKTPGLALALEIGKRLWKDQRQQAKNYFAYFHKMPSFTDDDISVAVEAAAFLGDGRDSKSATQLYRKLIDIPSTPRDVVKAILPKAITAARTATLFQDANRWQTLLNELVPPPPAAGSTNPQPAS